MDKCKTAATSRRLDEALDQGFPASDPASLTEPAGDARDVSELRWQCRTLRREGQDDRLLQRVLGRQPGAKAMRRLFETTVHVPAPADAIFARLDDQTRLAAHMERPSAMMGGGRMTYDFDEGRGQAVGSHIKMGGSAFGLPLYVDEVVTVREPPRRKAWETVGHPRLLVVGGYEMGFDVKATAAGCDLRVWIAYDLAGDWFGRWLGPLLAPLYAKWCVGRMANDAVAYFGRPTAAASVASA